MLCSLEGKVMFRIMTETEIAKSKAEVQKLYSTGLPEDHITAILMDVTFGGSGYPEATARIKAKTILKIL